MDVVLARDVALLAASTGDASALRAFARLYGCLTLQVLPVPSLFLLACSLARSE